MGIKDVIKSAAMNLPYYVVVAGGLTGAYRQYQYFRKPPDSYYADSTNRKLDPDLEKLVNETALEFAGRLSPAELASMRFYHTSLPNINLIGSFKVKPAPHIGLPANFLYRDPSDVDLSSYPGLDSETSTALCDSLVLSKQAKQFAISQTLHCANTLYFLSKATFLPGLFIGIKFMDILWKYIEKAPYLIQLGGLTAVTLTVVCLVYIGEMAYGQFRVLRADNKAASHGKEYLEGGIEYFDKLMERNKVLRRFLPDGELWYLEDGDVRLANRDGHYLSLKTRRENLIKYRDAYT